MCKLILVLLLLSGCSYSQSYYVIKDSYNTYSPAYTYAPAQNYSKTYQTPVRNQPTPTRFINNQPQKADHKYSFKVGDVEYYLWRSK